MKQGSFSIVIPFYNASGTILQTLQAIENSTIYPNKVICVHDASTDNGLQLVNQFASTSKINFLITKTLDGKRGAAAARNLGSQSVQEKYLLFLDSDVVVHRNTFMVLLNRIESQSCAAVVALFASKSLQPGFLAHFQAFTVNAVYDMLYPLDSPCFGTQCVLLETRQFRTLGGFDEIFPGATVEDFAFGYRLREQGGVICIAKDAIITHNHKYTLHTFVLNYFKKAQELTLLLLKHDNIRASDTGYHQSENIFTLIFIGFFITASLAELITQRIYFLLISILFLLLTFGVWIKYLRDVWRKEGLITGISFTSLKILVVVIGWLGVGKGIIIALSKKHITVKKLLLRLLSLSGLLVK